MRFRSPPFLFALLLTALRPLALFGAEAVTLSDGDHSATFTLSEADAPVVRLAANALAGDWVALGRPKPELTTARVPEGKPRVIIGTFGKFPEVDNALRAAGVATDALRGKHECFVIAPLKDGTGLVVAGSDSRGTAYGVFELSRRLGVSPWIDWADVRPEPRASLRWTEGTVVSTEPAVAYRGIFLNDEDWGLRPWAAKGPDADRRNIGAKTYSRIFELLLRLKANLIWPAMHPGTEGFFQNPANVEAARDYGIFVGSSHCEPMLRNNVAEWGKSFEREYGKKPGPWEFSKNRDAILRYWRDRVKTGATMDGIYTLGMRGVHDGPMEGYASKEERVAALSEIIAEQRKMLAAETRRPLPDIPQVFCPYKEVLELYRAGVKVPADVTLMWPDDNHGYVRQLPDKAERARAGGSGMYYHLSYWGAPSDYLWLSSTSPSLIGHEMGRAYREGVRRIWVANVGDLKPAETEMQYFLNLAYSGENTPAPAAWLREWAAENFGASLADDIAAIKGDYYRLCHTLKPEHLDLVRLSEPHLERREHAWKDLVARVDATEAKTPARLRDAFFELVAYPVKGAAAMNRKHAALQRAETASAETLTRLKDEAEAAHREIAGLTRRYNTDTAQGKWNGMMSAAPRGQRVFSAPSDFLKKKGTRQNLDTPDEPKARWDFAGDIAAPPGLVALPWLGITRGKGNATAELKLPLAVKAGEYRLVIRVTPTFPDRPGAPHRLLVAVGSGPEKTIDLTSKDTWADNVIRGYRERTLDVKLRESDKTLSVRFPDAGVVLESVLLQANP